jgi:hypothetical protein
MEITAPTAMDAENAKSMKIRDTKDPTQLVNLFNQLIHARNR